MEDPRKIKVEIAVEDIEIRGITLSNNLIVGKERGLQWRYQVLVLEKDGQPARVEMTPWVYASRPKVEEMLAKWRRYLDTGTFGPGTNVQ